MSKRSQLKEEKRLRNLLQKTFKVLANRKEEQYLEEQRLRKVIQKLLLEAEDEVVHPSTGINELRQVLKAVWKKSVYEYKRLATTPDQRRAFLHAWEWLFKEAFSGDVKRRAAAIEASGRVKKQGFQPEEAEEEVEVGVEEEEPIMVAEKTEKIDVTVTDKDGDGVIDTSEELAPVDVPTSEEEDDEEEVNRLTKAPADRERIGPDKAMKIFDETHSIVLTAFDELGGNDAEVFYHWFFINMLGSERSGFEEIAGKPIVGHFQMAEEELKNRGIETAGDLLPTQNEEDFNLPGSAFVE